MPHPGLSDAAIAANDRQVRALGKIRGVGDLPVITRDAATNYGDKGLYEVGDLIYRTLKADPEQGRELLDQTTSGMDSGRANRLKATVESLQQLDAPKTQSKAIGNLSNNHQVPIDPMDGSSGLHANDFEARRQGVGLVDDVNDILRGGKPLPADRADALKAKIDKIFQYDEDARLKAKAVVDAIHDGHSDDAENALRDLRAKAGDPNRLQAQRETHEYYAAYNEQQRLQHADQRGTIRGGMELKVRQVFANEAGISEQDVLIRNHQAAARNGDPNAGQIVARAEAKRDEQVRARERLNDGIAEDAARYQSIPSHPHPETDKRGARQHEDAENRKRTQKELATDAALFVTGVGIAAAGRKAAGSAAAGVTLNTTKAAMTYTRALNEATAAAMRRSGVDFADKKAVARWVTDNPEMSRQLSNHALQAGFASIAGGKAGSIAGNTVSNPVGRFVADEMTSEAVNVFLRPKNHNRK